jgi:hypothetical protein
MVHAGQGEDTADFWRTVLDAELGVVALHFPGSLENQAKHR